MTLNNDDDDDGQELRLLLCWHGCFALLLQGSIPPLTTSMFLMLSQEPGRTCHRLYAILVTQPRVP